VRVRCEGGATSVGDRKYVEAVGGQLVSEDDPREDLRDRGSAAVKAALAVGCQVCEAGPGEDCKNLTGDFRLPRQRIVHFCRVPFPTAADIVAPEDEDARAVGAAADIVDDGDDDRVFLGGDMAHVWDAGDTAVRRFAASLVRIKVAAEKTLLRPPNVFGMATRWVTLDVFDATDTPTLLALLVPQSGGRPARPQ
jgi:hypothetical protein